MSDRIKDGDLSPLELVEACLERIEKFDSSLDAFITVLEERARQDAKIAEKQIKEGLYIGPLHGVPFSIKNKVVSKTLSHMILTILTCAGFEFWRFAVFYTI
jgi:Asp-tRNA(Asn)/Glu-tRNA(Gln) amidotransferase A subunit family amidase